MYGRLSVKRHAFLLDPRIRLPGRKLIGWGGRSMKQNEKKPYTYVDNLKRVMCF